MGVRSRLAALAGAIVLLAALDATIACVDVFELFLPTTRPTSLFASINYQLSELVSRLRGLPAGPPRVLLLGNSQMEAAIRPLGALERALADAGAPPDTRAVSLCVFATAPTDAEVITRHIGALHPWLAMFGIAAPDVGTPLERAREMPVTQLLDIGIRDGLVPPADMEARFDRWVRTGWRLYRYRALFRDLLLPPDEMRTPGAFLESRHTPEEVFALSYGRERAAELLALRARFERSQRAEDFLRYVAELRGPDYLPGLRGRWRGLAPDALQLEALRRAAAHVRAAGARPVWILLPENPLLERDPEVGAEVAAHSAEVAARLSVEAETAGVPLLDLRRAVTPGGFLDLNHLVYYSGELMPALASALATRGLLREPERARDHRDG